LHPNDELTPQKKREDLSFRHDKIPQILEMLNTFLFLFILKKRRNKREKMAAHTQVHI
jgi:hypothetical protein